MNVQTNSAQTSFQGVIGRTVQDSVPWWPERPKAPEGAPNVVYIVLDDTGFSHLGCYGSDISTPNIDKLAEGGLRYSNFHTTAICSPTRASLLTGRDAHSVGLSFVALSDTGYPNNRSRISRDSALISETLKASGYSTFAVGKWHLLPGDEISFAGPFEDWPLGRGFEHYYGFLGGETSQWNPELVMGNERIPQPRRAEEGYHLTEDLTDKAIDYIRKQKSAAPEKPFFCYLAYGATHAPHHAPQSYIDAYKGKYDKGWDVVREEWFNRQKELGIIPAHAELPPRNPGIRPWADLSADEQKLFARMQEVFAGFLQHLDDHVGRLVGYLEEIGQLDNTVIVLLSDNGASPEGGLLGSWNEWKNFNLGMRNDDLAGELARISELGTPAAYNHYPLGWAQVGNTPLKWYKTFVHAGGVKDPLIIHYPNRIKDGGGIRSQYHHVSDVTPTVLDLIGIQPPESVNGYAQRPLDGVSLQYTFDSEDEPTRKELQLYEMVGNRAIWQQGWKAVARHVPGTSFEEDVWELYHTDEDFSENRNLADKHPEKLQQLIDLWWSEARARGYLPLNGTYYLSRGDDDARGAGPKLIRTYYPSDFGLDVALSPNTRNQSYSFTAHVERQSVHDEGVLVSFGGRFGGYALFVQQNRLIYHYNYLGEKHTVITSELEIPVGAARLRFEFHQAPEGGGGTGRLFINEVKAGEGIIPQVASMVEGPGVFSVGENEVTPVSPVYEVPFRFGGLLRKVDFQAESLNLGEDQKLQLELAKD
ncbi:arylsulfatase [Paenibacillus lutrae]|uniref:Sulfatase-like hydrolase/transferase n=1 Tax=Paenibacillus lutrae TaxID=2078573 RepID=A0A7X3JXH5_9BACL|nr:arylsulfatase [Paenibacillus lutrae]MVO98058.1 sulfatase-like hydrolase/transferase [Paenibacillus lutrae]